MFNRCPPSKIKPCFREKGAIRYEKNAYGDVNVVLRDNKDFIEVKSYRKLRPGEYCGGNEYSYSHAIIDKALIRSFSNEVFKTAKQSMSRLIK